MNEKLLKQYDRQSKQLLKHKDILAYVLKLSIPEYKDLSLEEIKNHYILDILDYEDSEMIEGRDTEYNLGNYQFRFDVAVDILLPNQNKSHVGIELQRKSDPMFSHTARAYLYTAMQSLSQIGKNITHQNYEKLEKVYEIWLFLKPPISYMNSILKIHPAQTILYGSAKLTKEYYDFFSIFYIFLGKNATMEIEELDVLDAIFSTEMDIDQRKEILGKSNMSDSIRTEIIQNKSLGLELWEDALEQGIEQEKFENILALIDYGMSFDQIASIFKLTKEEYQYYQNKLLQR